MDEAISHFPKKEQVELLTIIGDSKFVEPCMFGEGMYVSVFFKCYVKDIFTDIS